MCSLDKKNDTAKRGQDNKNTDIDWRLKKMIVLICGNTPEGTLNILKLIGLIKKIMGKCLS